MTTQRSLDMEDTSKAHPVLISVTFLKVGEIDTLQETFQADVFVRARWREASLDHSTDWTVENAAKMELWNPKILVQNLVGSPKIRILTEVEFTNEGKAYIVETRRIRGEFSEHLELQSFPFDVQDLSLLITSELRNTEVNLVEDEEKLSRVNPLGFMDEQEWLLRDYVQTVSGVNLSHQLLGSKKKYSTLTFKFAAFRRPGFFVWNIIVIMALISCLSLTTFAVSFTLPQHRLQMTFTLVLTGVAFKSAATRSLPKIPYLTYLDKYIIGCMFILCMVCVWHAVVTLLDEVTTGEMKVLLDRAMFGLLAAVFFFFHLIFGLVVFVKSTYRKQLIYTAEKSYQEKALVVYGESYNVRRKQLHVKRSRIDVIM